jgi:hypothetical protein
MHAMRAGIHSTLGSSPGGLVFNREMFLNIPLIANWNAITQKREHLIHENLIQENQKRRWYDYLPAFGVLFSAQKINTRILSMHVFSSTFETLTFCEVMHLWLTLRMEFFQVDSLAVSLHDFEFPEQEISSLFFTSAPSPKGFSFTTCNKNMAHLSTTLNSLLKHSGSGVSPKTIIIFHLR